MNASFEDIRSRISEPPSWFDSNGTPRYGDFHPDLRPDIYAHEVALLEIACQSCGERFLVEEHSSTLDAFGKAGSLRNRIVKGTIHYGDPPRHGNCAGETMNCEDLRILQFWQLNEFEWERVSELEIALPDAKPKGIRRKHRRR
jgi:DNA-directed RNA polymerase subunit RPC12/RpoP